MEPLITTIYMRAKKIQLQQSTGVNQVIVVASIGKINTQKSSTQHNNTYTMNSKYHAQVEINTDTTKMTNVYISVIYSHFINVAYMQVSWHTIVCHYQSINNKSVQVKQFDLSLRLKELQVQPVQSYQKGCMRVHVYTITNRVHFYKITRWCTRIWWQN